MKRLHKKGKRKLRVFEAFAGYGSQSIALRNLGIPHEVVAISEIDKYAIKAYYALHDKNILNLGDISKIKVEDIPEHDLFTYSFPCQDLSVAGKQAGLGKRTRSGLLYECEKIIEHCRPKYLLLENVKNLVGKKFKPQFDEWLDYLESLGYTNYWKVLNAKDYGVPQNRGRVFVVSILGNHEPYEFPKAIPLDKCIADILEDEVDEKYYMNKPFRLVNKGHQAELDIKGNECIRRVYGIDKIAPTLTTMGGGHREPKVLIEYKGKEKDNYVIEKTYRIRKLTPRECVRLMGMKDSDIDKIQQAGISNTQQYKMAGNSIVIDVLEAIFSNLFTTKQGGDTMKNIETTSKKNPIKTAGKTTQPKKPVDSKTKQNPTCKGASAVTKQGHVGTVSMKSKKQPATKKIQTDGKSPIK